MWVVILSGIGGIFVGLAIGYVLVRRAFKDMMP